VAVQQQQQQQEEARPVSSSSMQQQQQGPDAPGSKGSSSPQPVYSVTLDGVEVTYSIDASTGHLTVLGAAAKVGDKGTPG